MKISGRNKGLLIGAGLTAAFAVYSFGPEEDPAPTKPETAVTPEENGTAPGGDTLQTAPIINPGTAVTDEPNAHLMDLNRLCGISFIEFGKQTEKLDLSNHDTLLSLYYTCKYNERTDDFVMEKIFYAAIKNGNDEIFGDRLYSGEIHASIIKAGTLVAASAGRPNMLLTLMEQLDPALKTSFLAACYYEALLYDQVNVAETLINTYPEHFSKSIKIMDKYIHAAVRNHSRDALDFLIRQGADKGGIYESALLNNNMNIAEWVIEQGYDRRNAREQILIDLATNNNYNNRAKITAYFLQNHPDISQPTLDYALLMSVYEGYTDSAKLLRRHGATFELVKSKEVHTSTLRIPSEEMDAFLRNNGFHIPPREQPEP